MPVRVRHAHSGEGGKPWKIVEVSGGAVVGESDTKQDAIASAVIRNREHEKKKTAS